MLLVPWVPFAPLCAMAFDPGPSFEAYLFVTCVWSYPVTVFLAFILRQRVPMIGFLPCLNFAILFVYGFFERLHIVK
jgi:hypothetical protein